MHALLEVWARPFQSLPSRITFFVFVVSLTTSLIVIWTSIHSTYAFLSEEIDRKFPAILNATTGRVDLWLQQRKLDLDTYARSATLSENAAALRRPSRSRARRAVEQYLAYVLERSDQYAALFALDPHGNTVVWVGAELELDEEVRSDLARVAGPSVDPFLRVDGRRVPIASAPVRDRAGRQGGSLHAALRAGALEALLVSDDLGPAGEIYLVGIDGTYLTPAHGGRYARPLPTEGTPPTVDHYTNTAGTHVVGSAARSADTSWTMVVEEPYSAAFAPVLLALYRLAALNLGIVLLFSLIAFRIATSVVRPLKALSQGAQRVAEGETDVSVAEPKRRDETGLLIRTFNDMVARLRRNQLELEQNRLEIEAANSRLRAQNEELERANEALERLSVTDGLTELYNHRYFQDRLRQEMAAAERSGEPLALVLIDIDDFKRLNDCHGHSAGDALLRQIAGVMRASVRESDTLARYGGDEFGLLAPRTDAEGALTLAEKLRRDIESSALEVDDVGETVEVHLTVSIGIAAFQGDRIALFERADRALYRAKASGKNCVVLDCGGGPR